MNRPSPLPAIGAIAALPVAMLLVLLLTMGATTTALPGRPAPVAAQLNEAAIPTWALAPLSVAAAACPEVTAPLLAAQIHVESSWNPDAYNTGSQATGLAQFIPGTWAEFGRDHNGDGTANPRDPADAIPTQTRYMCHLVDLLRGWTSLTGQLVDLALAAYNAGPGNVRRHNGIPPFPETTLYVRKVRDLATTTYALAPPADDLITAVIAAAQAHVGRTPYAWGGGTLTGPSRGMPPDTHVIGFDCSSLVRHAFHQGSNGTITLPRTAQEQYNATRNNPIPVDQLQPGDLLFWGTGLRVHHVALYVGEGQMIEAPRSGTLITLATVRLSGDHLGATRPSTAATSSM
ncbi:MAG TPA: NlpC/P60 family protein [Pseudonocardiaceae bacterium]